MNHRLIRFDAFAIADGTGFTASPGSVLVELAEPPRAALPTLLAAGPTDDVRRHPASRDALAISRPASLLIPGLVNAHAHLDLTHIGPRPHDATADTFVAWIDMIRSRRCRDDQQIAASVRRGIDLSLAGGTVAVGDIAGAPGGRPSLAPWRTLRESPLLGVSFIEFFSIGRGREQGLAAANVAVGDLAGAPGGRPSLAPWRTLSE